jgi:hypothetical protein
MEMLQGLQEHQDGRVRGWFVRDLLDAAGADARAARVEVIGDGEPVTLSAEQLAGSGTFIKRNQKGQLVLQVWREGERDRPYVQLRGVTRIVLSHIGG